DLAKEVRLAGGAVAERQVRPREWRPQGGRPPRPGKPRQPFETLGRYANELQKSPVQLARRRRQFGRERGNRDRGVCRDQPVDGVDDELVGQLRTIEMFDERGLE